MVYVCKSCNAERKSGMTLREFIGFYGLDRERIEEELELQAENLKYLLALGEMRGDA